MLTSGAVDVRAALTELVTYFTAAVMNLCMWLPASNMPSPVSGFMSVRACEREREREGWRLTDLYRHCVSARVNMIKLNMYLTDSL